MLKNEPNVLILDFDGTTINLLSYLPDENGDYLDGTKLSLPVRRESLRLPDFFPPFLKDWHEQGNICYIVTKHGDIPHVASYVEAFFIDSDFNLGDDDKETFSYEGLEYGYYYHPNKLIPLIFSCPHPESKNKNAAIKASLVLLDKLEHKSKIYNGKWSELPKSNLVLVDDTKDYCKAAVEDGMMAIHASASDTKFQSKLQGLIPIELNQKIQGVFHGKHSNNDGHAKTESKKQKTQTFEKTEINPEP